MLENFPYDVVAKEHNECVTYLLRNVQKEAPLKDIIDLAVAYVASQDESVNSKLLTDWVTMRVRSSAFLCPLGSLGLSNDLIARLNRFRKNVGVDFSEENLTAANQKLKQDAQSLSELEAFQAILFGSVYQYSAQIWNDENEDVITSPAYGASHVYTDWDAVMVSDAAGVIGEAALMGLAAMLSGVAVPVGATGLGIVVAAGAMASFMFLLSGEAERPIEREPITPGSGPGDEERPGV